MFQGLFLAALLLHLFRPDPQMPSPKDQLQVPRQVLFFSSRLRSVAAADPDEVECVEAADVEVGVHMARIPE